MALPLRPPPRLLRTSGRDHQPSRSRRLQPAVVALLWPPISLSPCLIRSRSHASLPACTRGLHPAMVASLWLLSPTSILGPRDRNWGKPQSPRRLPSPSHVGISRIADIALNVMFFYRARKWGRHSKRLPFASVIIVPAGGESKHHWTAVAERVVPSYLRVKSLARAAWRRLVANTHPHTLRPRGSAQQPARSF